MAINIARESRQILGGMGIMGEFPMMRHAANLESVITYEGTEDVHLLITGLDITRNQRIFIKLHFVKAFKSLTKFF